MLDSSVGSHEVGPLDRILALSRSATRARRLVLCPAMRSVSLSKRQRQQIIFAIVVCLLSSTVAQHEGSSVVPSQTFQAATEVSSASLVSRPSTETRQTVEQDLQNPSTEVQLDFLALGRNLQTTNLEADPVDPTFSIHIAGTSWSPSEASGPLSSSSPVEKNSLEVLDLAASSLGGALATTDASLNASSQGLRESTDVSQPVAQGESGFFPTVSPVSPLRPDVGSASRSDVTPAFQTALAYPLNVTTPNAAAGMAQATTATDLTSVKPSASEGSTLSQDLLGTSQPQTEISHTTHLDQKSTSHSTDGLPSAETEFLTHRVVKGASVSPKMLGTSVSLPTLPTGMVPSEATRGTTDVFHSTSRVTAQSPSESIPLVSTGMNSGSLPPGTSPRSVISLQEGTEPATRDPLESTAVPTALPPSSAWPVSSYSHTHVTLPAFVTQVTSLETEGLASRSPLVPVSVGSPKLGDAITLSTSTVLSMSLTTAEEGTEVPLSITPQTETTETRSGIGEGTVPLVPDLAAGSTLGSKETLSHSSTPQNLLGSGVTSGFPVSSASLPVTHTPRTGSMSSSGAPSRIAMGPTSHSPTSPAVLPSAHFPLSTVPLEHEAVVAAGTSTEAVLPARLSPTSGEGSTRLGSTSWVSLSASLGTTEWQESFPTTGVLPSSSMGEGTGREWKEAVSRTAELPTGLPRHTSTSDSQNEPTSLSFSSSVLPTDVSSLPNVSVEAESAVPSLHSWASTSTTEALPSSDVTDFASYKEETQPELHDETGPITAVAGKVPDSISELPLAASSVDSSSSTTSATLGVSPAGKHFALSTVKVRSVPTPGSTFLMTASKGSSEAQTVMVSSATEGAGSASVPVSRSHASTVMSNATLSSQFQDAAGVVHPFQTTAGGTQHVGRVMGSPSPNSGRELFDRTPSPLPTLLQVLVNRTEVMETARATETSMDSFVHSTRDRSSSQVSVSLSDGKTKSAVMPQPNATQGGSPSSVATGHPLPTSQAGTVSSSAADQPESSRILPTTQAVSPSSSIADSLDKSTILPTTSAASVSSTATDLPASSRIHPTTQTVSPSSTATELLTRSRILPFTQTVSPSSITTDQPASSRILPTTQAVFPLSTATELLTRSRILPSTQTVSQSTITTDQPASSRILPTTQAVSQSSTATNPPASSRIHLTTQAVSPSSITTELLTRSRILPPTQTVSPSSITTDQPASSKIIPTTQAVSLSSSTKDPLTRSRILPTTQTVSPSSTATAQSAKSRILPTTQAVSPSSAATDQATSSRILLTTQAVSPSSAATDQATSCRILSTTQTMSPSSASTDLLGMSRIHSTTKAMSPSSAATDLPASSRILPTTQTVSSSSSATDQATSSRILLITRAASPSSAATDLPVSSDILPTTQTVSSSSSATDPLGRSLILSTTKVVSPSSTATDWPASSSILATTQDVFQLSSVTGSRILSTTQAVSPSSSVADQPASSRTLPITQAVAPSSSTTDQLTRSRILHTTPAVSPSSSATDSPAISRILPTTQAVSPSSFATDPPAISRIPPTTLTVSTSSSTTEPPAIVRILPTTPAISPSSSATELLAISRIFPKTLAVSPSSSTTESSTSSRILPITPVVSPSSSATDLLAISRIFPKTLAVSPSSSTTEPSTSSRILPTTHAVSPSSSATVPSASSRILLSTLAVSPSSSATETSTDSRILPTTQAVSLSSSTSGPPASSRILPTAPVLTTTAACRDVHCLNSIGPASFAPVPRTSSQLPQTPPTPPPTVLVTTLESTVGKTATVASSSTKIYTPKMTYTTGLTGTKPGTITRDVPTSEHLVSAPRASTVGQTAERDNITLSRRTIAMSILRLEFHLTRIDYTESLADKSSARYKELEGEVILTLNRMLSFYETFLQASVLRFLNGSVIAQTEAVFRGDGLVPTPSDVIRMIVTAAEEREIDAFFDWRVDLGSLRCNGFSLENLDPEVLAVSFTLLGQGSIATFGGITDWGPLEGLRNEVVQSLGIRYKVQNFSLVQVRNVQGDLDISGEVYVNTAAHVDISWALEAMKGLANYSVDLGSVCINDLRLSLQIFPVSFLVTNMIFNEKLLDRSSTARQSLSWNLSKTLMQTLRKYKNLLQVTIREVRGGSLICYADVIFQPPAPTSKDLVQALALSVGPKNYLGSSGIQVDPFSFTVAGVTLEPPFASPGFPGYGIALIVLGGLALIIIPLLVLLYKHLGWKEKMIIHRAREPELMVETFELDNPTFRPLIEDNGTPSSSPTVALG